MTLTIGQPLTPSQVRDLPDGAKVSMSWSYDKSGIGLVFTAPFGVQQNADGCRGEWWFGELEDDVWAPNMWHSATLVSLPSIEPQAQFEMVDKDEHYRRQTEPSPGEGYRWLIPKVDVLRSDDEWQNQNCKFAPLPDWCVGAVVDGSMMYRRRLIEPQAEPIIDPVTNRDVDGNLYLRSKKPKAASEIEKEASPIAQKAARALLDATIADMVDNAQPNGIECMYGLFGALCHDYLAAMKHARAIGAIE